MPGQISVSWTESTASRIALLTSPGVYDLDSEFRPDAGGAGGGDTQGMRRLHNRTGRGRSFQSILWLQRPRDPTFVNPTCSNWRGLGATALEMDDMSK